MTIYTLYLKIHKITGLRYLGQTKKDPFLYQGSGTDWMRHLNQHGYIVDTQILLQTTDRMECSRLGRWYSTIWNIVNAQDDYGNKIYANRIPETGGGGPMSEHTKKLLSISKLGNTFGFKKGNKSGNRASGFKIGNKYGFKSGSSNLNYDADEYQWTNTITGESVKMTRSAFIHKFNMNRGAISRLLNHDPSVRTVKGWKIK